MLQKQSDTTGCYVQDLKQCRTLKHCLWYDKAAGVVDDDVNDYDDDDDDDEDDGGDDKK